MVKRTYKRKTGSSAAKRLLVHIIKSFQGHKPGRNTLPAASNRPRGPEKSAERDRRPQTSDPYRETGIPDGNIKNKNRLSPSRHIPRKGIVFACTVLAVLIVSGAVFAVWYGGSSARQALANTINTQDPPQSAGAAATGAQDASAGASPSDASPDPLGSSVFKQGAQDPLVAFIQQRLMDLNYMDDAPTDDTYGPVTTASVMLFQREENLPIDGNVDSQVYTLLMSPGAPEYAVSLGAQGTDVTELISRLYELGYIASSPDTFTADVKTAVQKFQQVNGLSVDGTIGTNTKEMLYSDHVKPNTSAFGAQDPKLLGYQKRLKTLGYLTTTPDGTYGGDTINAVKRFQNLNGIIATGYLGPETISALTSGDAQANALILGMNGSDITNVQQRLDALNYLDSVTGYFGSVTEDAVKAFQTKNGLSVDGKVGQETMNALLSKSAKPKGGSAKSSSAGSAADSSYVDKFIQVAESKLGSPYILGAKGPDTFDCSGFVYWCLNHAGVVQSYMTSATWQGCTKYQRIDGMNNLIRGDVISFKGHVAIYLGNGQMISALNGIQYSSNIWGSAYWSSHFVCGFRIF